MGALREGSMGEFVRFIGADVSGKYELQETKELEGDPPNKNKENQIEYI